ncbi:MAG: glycosyltransferase family 2 protein [Deltaproteobacteria bacterium]|nr:glycosyltransferase family 2 protein [Deltaproteobacteria bacterium]
MKLDKKILAMVISHGRPDSLKRCIQGLHLSNTRPDWLYILDNGIGSREQDLSGLYPGPIKPVEIRSKENLGFAGGVNYLLGHVKKLSWDFLFLLNDDAVVHEGCLGSLVETTVNLGHEAILGPLVRELERPWKIESSGIAVNNKTFRIRQLHEMPEKKIVSRAAVSGCSMFIPRSIIEKLGGFDSKYFMYFEDIDFCLKASRAGIEILVSRDAQVFHEGGRLGGPKKVYYSTRNQLRLAKRNMDGTGFIFAAPFILAFNLAASLRRKQRHAGGAGNGALHSRLTAFFHGAADGLKGLTGRGEW